MAFALVTNNVPRELSPNEAVQTGTGTIPVRALNSWTEPQRNAISVYSIGHAVTPVPSDQKVVGEELRYDQPSNTVKWYDILGPLPLDERKRTMHNQVVAKFGSVLTAGYSHDFGPAFNGVHVLDTSREKKPEWLDYRNACQEQVDAGSGSAVMTVPIRTKAEPPVDLHVRANQGMSAMTGMRTREGNVILHARSKDDAVRTAVDHAALDAIDINAGWPV